MASNLVGMASNLIGMASNLIASGLLLGSLRKKWLATIAVAALSALSSQPCLGLVQALSFVRFVCLASGRSVCCLAAHRALSKPGPDLCVLLGRATRPVFSALVRALSGPCPGVFYQSNDAERDIILDCLFCCSQTAGGYRNIFADVLDFKELTQQKSC